ncbi:MAG: right-handed parallel beta-helix repeat-containing protein [Acidobacteria bacterium]|nr:right-handed parallel beta-helix repeat-containing protein [Acidobacteriota bacterium]
MRRTHVIHPASQPRMIFLMFLGVIVLLLFFVASANAADTDFSDGITVDSTTDAVDVLPGDGICASAANACTLRAAVQEANVTAGADTILLPAGTYTLTLVAPFEAGDDASVGDLDITDSVDIVGVSAGTTIVDANGLVLGDRAFQVTDPLAAGLAVSFTELTIQGGRVLNENGGGLLVEAPEGGPPVEAETAVVVTLFSCVVSDNGADSNLVGPDGKPIGGSGGGIYSTGELVLFDTSVETNAAAANGGGLYAGGPLNVVASKIAENHAESGGGIFDTGAHISNFSRCLIADNSAVGGGGINSRTQVIELFENCTIHGNTATDVGAGINTNGTVDLANCTVSDNVSDSDAPNGGAGLNSFGGMAFEIGTFRLGNTILAGNLVNAQAVPPDLPAVRNCGCTGGTGCSPGAQYVSFGFNLEDAETCTLQGTQDLTNADPQLSPLAFFGGNLPSRGVNPRSLATDGGTNAGSVCPAVDQRGLPRPVDGDGDSVATCDIGAYERQAPDMLVFYDDWEIGDSSRWLDVVSEPGTALNVNDVSAMTGRFGLEATLTGTTDRAYAVDDSPAADTHVAWSFLFDANGVTMADNTRHKVFQAFQEAPVARLVTMVLRYRDLTGMELRVKVHQNDLSWAGTGWLPIPSAGPVLVGIDWTRAAGPGTQDGVLVVSLEGVVADTVTGIDNDALGNVDLVRLGVTGGADPGTTGSHYFDEYFAVR